MLLCVIFSLELWTYNKGFYRSQYEAYGAAAEIGVTQDALDEVTGVLIDYLKGTRGDLHVMAEREGTLQPFFNQREIDHMVDVRALFDWMRSVRWVCLAVVLAGAALRPWRSGPAQHALLARTYLWTFGGVLLAVGVVAVFFAVDFESAWHFAHTLVFTNDLWILNPDTDMLINLVPLPFFIAICTRIVLTLTALLALLAAVAVWVLRKARGNKKGAAA